MAVKRYDGTAWQVVAGKGDSGVSSSITTWVKTATGGETSLTGSSDSSTTLAYTPGQEQFFINGVLQVRGSDYTATNGTSITGITALVAGDIATVTTVNAFSVTGAVPLSTVTANGDLIVGTSAGAVGRLGVGSTGQLLTVAGGVPTWAAAPSTQKSFTLLNSGGTSLTGAATITVSSIGGYDDYYVFVDDASTTGTNSFIGLRLNGNTTDYAQFGNRVTSEGTYTPSNLITQYSNLTNSSFILAMPSSNDSVSAGSVQIRGANNTGLKMLIGIGGTGNATFNGSVQHTTMGYSDAGGAAISSISLFSSAGNFDAGTMYIYGAN